MAEDLTQRFVDHRDVGFGAQGVAKLALHHRKCRFDVRPLVIALKKLFTFPHDEVKHVAPRLVLPGYSPVSAVGLEGDKRQGPKFANRGGVHGAQIAFVGRDFRNLEAVAGLCQAKREAGERQQRLFRGFPRR